MNHHEHTASRGVCLSLSSLPDGWWRKCSLWCARLEEPCLDFLLNTSFTQLCATLAAHNWEPVLSPEPTDSLCCCCCLQPFLHCPSQSPQQAGFWLGLHWETTQRTKLIHKHIVCCIFKSKSKIEFSKGKHSAKIGIIHLKMELFYDILTFLSLFMLLYATYATNPFDNAPTVLSFFPCPLTQP